MPSDSTPNTGPVEQPSTPDYPGRPPLRKLGDEPAPRTAEMSTQAPPDCEKPATDGTQPAGGTSSTSDAERFADFEILQTLGAGSFGKVYLARQVSLDRQVALKVTANRGNEARTLASLEHDHVVQVFSETVDRERNQRVLCMQYVPGTTLERIIKSLNERDRETWSGQAVLDAIDRHSQHPAVFHPAALRDRELLADSDYSQAVCWLGARMAEALDYAHSRGVLHRDIKPANILVNQYGRPLLADFNISSKATRTAEAGEAIFGGTLGYMSPEHIDAFDADDRVRETTDERSDIYSLGVVLFELLTGRRPFERPPTAAARVELLRDAAAARRIAAPSPRAHRPDVPDVLDRSVRRCLDPDPNRRYQSGAELARALEGCRVLRQAERELPPPGFVTSAALRRPFLLIAIFALLPHVLGSVVNISYNLNQIVYAKELTAPQTTAFKYLVLPAYNLVVYSACVWMLVRLILPAFRLWPDLAGPEMADRDRVTAVRRRVLTWPMWIVALSCLGWLPGGLVFPVTISLRAGTVGLDVFGHFLVSFTVSGLIALTYSFFGVQYAALRIFYPKLWADAADFRATASVELGPVAGRLRLFQVLAGVIPLAGAILLVGGGSEASDELTFRLIVTALIALGMTGFGLAVHVNKLITRTVSAFVGAEVRRRTP